MRKSFILTLLVSFLCSGCAMRQLTPITLYSSFDGVHAKELLQKGTNTVNGNAFMRQNGGGVVTCAGSEVMLIPATNYATERMQAIYGNTTDGFTNTNTLFTPDIPDYYKLVIKTRCDSQGNFTFKDVANGEFYALTVVSWAVGYSRQGGALMQKVSISGGETKDLILSR